MIKEFEIEYDDLCIVGEAEWECQDVGIGPYEFWGAKGYDSRMEYRVEWVKISSIDGEKDHPAKLLKETEDWAKAYLDNTECEWPTEKDEPEPPRDRDERDEPSYTDHPYYEGER
jgi:hypothetical protein